MTSLVSEMDQNKFLVSGFKAAATAAGLKKNNALDFGVIFSEREAVAAGVFTSNLVKAAPVILTQQHIGNGKARAIIANAGNANACTGQAGLNNALKTAELLSKELGIHPSEVLVASTGVIGKPLDMNLISAAIPKLAGSLSEEALDSVAKAIMTTDSFPKISRFEGQAGDRKYIIQGIAKGAGMIMPNMATMLCFIMSDVLIDAKTLKRALLSSVGRSFNRITVDGDTSTNDMVLVLANGMAENRHLTDADTVTFTEGLTNVMEELSRMIVQDGEGATKLVDIIVKGAFSASDADQAARTVGNSSLVKTAFYGQDPNWGRIIAALGRSGIKMEEKKVQVWVNDIQIVADGQGRGVEAEKKAAGKMAEKEFSLTIDLEQGVYEGRIVTCDLTHEYISINADYRT